MIRRTYDIAHAAGTDAGNRSMLAGGRTTWNLEDYDAARLAFDLAAPKPWDEECLPPLHIPGCEHRGEETGQEYAKRIKERDDAQDQRWTSGEV